MNAKQRRKARRAWRPLFGVNTGIDTLRLRGIAYNSASLSLSEAIAQAREMWTRDRHKNPNPFLDPEVDRMFDAIEARAR